MAVEMHASSRNAVAIDLAGEKHNEKQGTCG
jgi:hypothetical protein